MPNDIINDHMVMAECKNVHFVRLYLVKDATHMFQLNACLRETVNVFSKRMNLTSGHCVNDHAVITCL